MMTIHHFTHRILHGQKSINWVLNRFRIHRIIQTWSPAIIFIVLFGRYQKVERSLNSVLMRVARERMKTRGKREKKNHFFTAQANIIRHSHLFAVFLILSFVHLGTQLQVKYNMHSTLSLPCAYSRLCIQASRSHTTKATCFTKLIMKDSFN